MARTRNITVPARFSFTPYQMRWMTIRAEIIGWPDERRRATNPLPRQVARALDEVRRLEFPLGSVMVRIDVPPAKAFGATEVRDHIATARIVEISRSCIPPELLAPHESPRSAPDISGRFFDVLICAANGFGEERSSVIPVQGEKDAWEMRNEFLNLRSDVPALCEFLNRWGCWSGRRGYAAPRYSRGPDGIVMREKASGLMLAFPVEIWERSSYFRSALTGTPRSWLRNSKPLDFSSLEEPPYLAVKRSFCEMAIEDTITIDHLSRVRFGICRREDCRKLFKRVTKQKRFYCDPACAHLANVRKLREQKKKSRRGKGEQGDAKG